MEGGVAEKFTVGVFEPATTAIEARALFVPPTPEHTSS